MGNVVDTIVDITKKYYYWNSVMQLIQVVYSSNFVQGRRHQGGGTSSQRKMKKGKQKKKEKVSNQKSLKDCHQGHKITVLAILERLEFENFPCRPTVIVDNTFWCSMAPPLWNPFWRHCYAMLIITIKLSDFHIWNRGFANFDK